MYCKVLDAWMFSKSSKITLIQKRALWWKGQETGVLTPTPSSFRGSAALFGLVLRKEIRLYTRDVTRSYPNLPHTVKAK